jgi:hypothetical protein
LRNSQITILKLMPQSDANGIYIGPLGHVLQDAYVRSLQDEAYSDRLETAPYLIIFRPCYEDKRKHRWEIMVEDEMSLFKSNAVHRCLNHVPNGKA